MMSVLQKLQLQKTVAECTSKLRNGISNIAERLSVQKLLRETVAELKGVAVPDSNKKIEDQDTKPTPLYNRLIAGEFYSLAPIAFMAKLKEVAKEIGEDVTKLHDPSIEYLRIHEAEIF